MYLCNIRFCDSVDRCSQGSESLPIFHGDWRESHLDGCTNRLFLIRFAIQIKRVVIWAFLVFYFIPYTFKPFNENEGAKKRINHSFDTSAATYQENIKAQKHWHIKHTREIIQEGTRALSLINKPARFYVGFTAGSKGQSVVLACGRGRRSEDWGQLRMSLYCRYVVSSRPL